MLWRLRLRPLRGSAEGQRVEEVVGELLGGSTFVGLAARDLREWFEDPLVQEMHFRGLIAMHLRGGQAVAGRVGVL